MQMSCGKTADLVSTLGVWIVLTRLLGTAHQSGFVINIGVYRSALRTNVQHLTLAFCRVERTAPSALVSLLAKCGCVWHAHLASTPFSPCAGR